MVRNAIVRLLKITLPKRVQTLLITIREDFVANGSDWTYPGFRAVAVYRAGVFADAIESRVLRAAVMRVYLVFYRWTRNHYGVELEHTVRIGRRFALAHQGNIVIHRFARIGDDCLVRQNVTMGAAFHRAYTDDEFAQTAPTLEDGVQVGCGAAIVGHVVVGRGARIGPNAVVISDVPAGATVFAAPSRVVAIPKVHNREVAGGREQDAKAGEDRAGRVGPELTSHAG